MHFLPAEVTYVEISVHVCLNVKHAEKRNVFIWNIEYIYIYIYLFMYESNHINTFF